MRKCMYRTSAGPAERVTARLPEPRASNPLHATVLRNQENAGIHKHSELPLPLCTL